MSSIPQFTMRELLEAGVHFGHKTRRWNPKMQKFIHSEKDGVHIINLQKTVPLLHSALKKIHDVVSKNGRVIFVGTKPAAQDIIAEAAQRCGQHYINNRWLGGILTNWQTVSNSIRTLRKYSEILAEGGQGRTKKEKLEMSREVARLERSIGGIKDLGGLPDLIIVIDTNKEQLAITEAKRMGIPVIAVLDSNSSPENIDFPVPGNDDSIRAIKLYCKLFSDAALSGISASLGANPKKAAAVADEKPEPVAVEAAPAPEAEEKKDNKPKVETVIKKSRAVKKKADESTEETKKSNKA
jgi:small subunit ribosomal protein S2